MLLTNKAMSAQDKLMPRGLGPLNRTWLQHFKISVSGLQLRPAAGQAPHTANYWAADLQ